jgi:choice-of-anchor C domain-containing protein
VAVAATFALASTAANAAAFQNGSFETNTLNATQLNQALVSPGFTTLGAGDTSITGWTVGGNTIDYIGTYWTPADGTYSLDMSGDSPGSISQTFDTVSGQTYNVGFDLAGNPAGPPIVKTMDVDVGGAPTPFTFDTTGATLSNMGWRNLVYTFTASGASTTLTFTSLDTPGTAYGPALDNVSLTAVPEPATWAMMILGIGLIGAGMRLSAGKKQALA